MVAAADRIRCHARQRTSDATGWPFWSALRGYAKAHNIPVVNCSAGERKHDLAEDYLGKTTITQGLFLVLVGRAQAPVWGVSANQVSLSVLKLPDRIQPQPYFRGRR